MKIIVAGIRSKLSFLRKETNIYHTYSATMVMVSPCAGCDTYWIAQILALFEAISGITTIIKSAWWYWFFRIPVKKKTCQDCRKVADAENPASPLGESSTLVVYQPPSVDNNEIDPQMHPVQFQEREIIQPDYDTGDTDSMASLVSEANANNVLWTITGLVMGTLNIALGLFLLIGLTNVNYAFLIGWCLSLSFFYFLDCFLFTFLLKHCTSKERFEKCKSHYISSTIFSFVFKSYLLWVGISVIYWCHCRRDPYQCRFQRDYCYSFNLNFSEPNGEDAHFYDHNSDIYQPTKR